MAKEYSEKSFLLEIDDYSLVKRYLDDREIGTADFSYSKDTHKKKDTEETVAKIEEILRKQSDTVQQEIERDFQHINNLSNEKGTQNLLAEANDGAITLTILQLAEM